MEIKEQLKEHRARLGLSQEELADRIFVSRQTISNWETDRTYPDVQSLLLLSEIFGTSIDELVKGDVATMEKTIENEWKTLFLDDLHVVSLVVGHVVEIVRVSFPNIDPFEMRIVIQEIVVARIPFHFAQVDLLEGIAVGDETP